MSENITTITIDDLEDFSSDSTKIAPGSGTYGLLLRKVGNSYATFKFKLDALDTFFLAESDISEYQTIIQNFQENLEKKIATFVGAEYMEDSDYMQKNAADAMRKTLATEQTLQSELEKYMTQNDLKHGVQEALAYARQCASSYSASMASTAATAKGAISQANQMDNSLNELVETLDTSEE